MAHGHREIHYHSSVIICCIQGHGVTLSCDWWYFGCNGHTRMGALPHT